MTHPVEMYVGPVLMAGYMTDAVINALQIENPTLRVLDHGSYVCLQATNRCVLHATTVTRFLGRTFLLPRDLESILCSFQGKMQISCDQIIWESR